VGGIYHRDAMRSVLRSGGLVLLAALALAACGGSGGKSEKAASPEARAACEGSALAGDPKLPEGFPKLERTTSVSSTPTGPSQIVDGYFEGSVKDAHDEYEAELEAGGFDILFEELEEHDSELSWKGSGRTGQVALREGCGKDDRIYVHITSRPE
jgi:hypothetical protein